MIEAANAEEEALAIAVALREAVDDPGKSAALVTPDRALARRVLAAMARWNVPVDDSGGDALSDTPAGVFARLAAEAALDGLAPVTLLALLKHPSCKFDAAAVSTLERAILRGPRPKAGTAGLEHALQTFRQELEKLRRKVPSSLHRSDPRASLTDAELDAATDLVASLKAALEPLESLPPGPQPFRAVAARHLTALAALGGITEELTNAFDEIEAAGSLPIEPKDYIELFHAAIADKKVRRPEADVRVRIYGPLEARLQPVDRLVLGGLVEGVWPPETRGDPWLSRPMRHELGLDLPERRIGLSAHDFAQALGAPEVILTRAAKLGGAPTVASRFVQRLAAVAGEARWRPRSSAARAMSRFRACSTRRNTRRARSRGLSRSRRVVRPSSLSVTEIEMWLRDPYSIYARHVLGLRRSTRSTRRRARGDRGNMIHDAIGDFTGDVQGQVARRRGRRADQAWRAAFCGAGGFSRRQGLLVAALPAHRALVRRFRDARRRGTLKQLDAEISGTLEIPFEDRRVQACARVPTASSTATTGATRSSTTRPDRCRPRRK